MLRCHCCALRCDFAVGELAHLLADRFERVVEAAITDRRVAVYAHQFGEPRAARRRVAGADQVLDCRRHVRRDRGSGQAEIGGPRDLALAHGNAAEHLRQIFAGADAHDQLLGLAEAAGGCKPLGIGGELAHRLDIGRKPGEAVGRALFPVEHTRQLAAFDRDAVSDRARRIGEQGFDGADRLSQRCDQFMTVGTAGSGYCKRHKCAAPKALNDGTTRGRTA